MSILPQPPYDIAKAQAAAEAAATVLMQDRVYTAIVRLDEAGGGRGAPWESVLEACGARWDNSPECEVVEAAIELLGRAGRVYEPTLGLLKPK